MSRADKSTTYVFPPTRVRTPEVERMCSTVARWMNSQLPGGTVFGLPRCGKTTACKYLTNAIGELTESNVAVVNVAFSGYEGTGSNEREFYEELLWQVGSVRSQHSEGVPVLRQQFHDHLQETARAAGAERVLVIVDDAQNLCRQQVRSLFHAFSAWKLSRISPFLLLVGQPELRTLTATSTVWPEFCARGGRTS